ncbi:MAG: DUF1624 domain-containing protein [Oscillospiraceae bacterium]|jgi:uncharacterized membrane protein|nr:DUF1624 domain-containing protein [Oscillospiraceae bacterium]
MAEVVDAFDLTKFMNAQDAELGRKRVAFIDELRGLCVVLMLVYHCFYMLATFFEKSWAVDTVETLAFIKPAVQAVFVILSGISIRLSRDVFRRSLQMMVSALLLSLVTLLLLPQIGVMQAGVWFGVLHMLAVSAFLFHLFCKGLEKIPPILGVPVMLALFALTSQIPAGKLGFGEFSMDVPASFYETNILLPFGVHKPDLWQWDYFPLLPYFFIFLAGTFLGRWIQKGEVPDFCAKPNVVFLGVIGRKAMIIFLLHVPVFYGLAYLAKLIIANFNSAAGAQNAMITLFFHTYVKICPRAFLFCNSMLQLP